MPVERVWRRLVRGGAAAAIATAALLLPLPDGTGSGTASGVAFAAEHGSGGHGGGQAGRGPGRGGRGSGGHPGSHAGAGHVPGGGHVPSGVEHGDDHDLVADDDHDLATHAGHEPGATGSRGRGPRAGRRASGPGGGGEVPSARGHSGEASDGHSGEASDGHEEGVVGSRGGRGRDSASAVDRRAAGRSGRPVWAQGGIPEVELGRLNVSRAPGRVLDRALAEVEGGLGDASRDWYLAPLDQALGALPGLPRGVRIESPLQNLGLYRRVLDEGPGGTPFASGDRLDLAARLLGGAADKNLPITRDTVVAVNRILGVGTDLDEGQVAALADRADRVRQAILSAHGSTEHGESGPSH